MCCVNFETPLFNQVSNLYNDYEAMLQLPPLRGMENPDEEFDVEKDWPVVTQEEYDANPSGYRELCWDLKVCNDCIFHYVILCVQIVCVKIKPR